LPNAVSIDGLLDQNGQLSLHQNVTRCTAVLANKKIIGVGI
jgi:hypothetical protein